MLRLESPQDLLASALSSLLNCYPPRCILSIMAAAAAPPPPAGRRQLQGGGSVTYQISMILMVNVISTMVVADIQALPNATIPITLPGSNSA